MTQALKCPNCTERVADHPENGCLLAALVQVIRDRETMHERALRKLHANTDADALWNVLGPIADRLEEGHFTAPAADENARAVGGMRREQAEKGRKRAKRSAFPALAHLCEIAARFPD